MDSEGIQEEYSLRRLLYEIPEVREFFGEDLLFDLRGLLHERFGSNLRNRLAHGLVTDSEFLHSGASVYAWWLVLYLCCAPLLARQAAAQNNDTLNDDNQEADDEARRIYTRLTVRKIADSDPQSVPAVEPNRSKEKMTIRQRNSLYIDTYGPDEDAVAHGFHWLCQTAAIQENLSGTIAVPTLANLNGVIQDVLDEQITRPLAKHKQVKLNYPTSTGETEIELSLLFLRKRLSRFISGPVLAFYPNKAMLDMIDDMGSVSDVLVIPWLPVNEAKAMTNSLPLSVDNDIKHWIETWQAQILGAPKDDASRQLFYDPVVENALKALTRRVNLSTGISHPGDERAAIGTFKLLRNEGYTLDSEAIRAWLIRYNWSSGDADDVCTLVQKIVQNKRVGSRAVRNARPYEKGMLDLWKKWDDCEE